MRNNNCLLIYLPRVQFFMSVNIVTIRRESYIYIDQANKSHKKNLLWKKSTQQLLQYERKECFCLLIIVEFHFQTEQMLSVF